MSGWVLCRLDIDLVHYLELIDYLTLPICRGRHPDLIIQQSLDDMLGLLTVNARVFFVVVQDFGLTIEHEIELVIDFCDDVIEIPTLFLATQIMEYCLDIIPRKQAIITWFHRDGRICVVSGFFLIRVVTTMVVAEAFHDGESGLIDGTGERLFRRLGDLDRCRKLFLTHEMQQRRIWHRIITGDEPGIFCISPCRP